MDFFISLASFSAATLVHFAWIAVDKQVSPDTAGIYSPGLTFGNDRMGMVASAYLAPALLVSFFQVVVFFAIDLYHPRRGLSLTREFAVILRGVALNLMLVLAILFFYRGTSYSRLVIVYYAFLSPLLLMGGHYGFRQLMQSLGRRGIGIRKVMVLGAGKSARRLMDTLQRHSIYGYRVVGVLGKKSEADSHFKDLIVGEARNFQKIARELNPDIMIHAMEYNPAFIGKVIEYCDSEGIDCRIVPDYLDLVTHHARIEVMDSLPILTIRDIPLKNGYNRFMKRLLDVVFSAAVLVCISPLLLFLAILIKITSRGPVFFLQDRVGLDRHHFKVIKFRTMYVQDKKKSDTIWGSKNDSRVTPLGNIMRKTALDELPQFINVLKGDMSVVGPRPERPHFVTQFKERYAHYMRRHSVKSGITGWAQIHGLRGDTSIEKRVELDIYYIENWSLIMDLAIIFRTIPSMIRNPGE